MRVKLAIAIGLGILALTFMIAIKITSLGTEQRSRFLMESVQSEAGLAKTNAALLEKNYVEILTQAASLEESIQRESTPGVVNTAFLKSPFLTIAMLEPGGSDGWKLRWLKNKSDGGSGWLKADEKKLTKELPLAGVNDENVTWHRHLSKTGHALYTFMIKVQVPLAETGKAQSMVALAVLNNQAFSTVVENFKSTTREVLVLDDKGHALAYTSQQYVGAPMDSHPMVAALLKERRVIEVGEFKDRSGDAVIGAYERLDGSNLYVAVAQKLGSFPSLFSAQLLSLIGLSVASFLIAVALGFILVRPTIAAYEYLQDLAIALGQGLPLRQPAHFAEMPPVLIQSIQKLQQDGVAHVVPPAAEEITQPVAARQSQAPAVSEEDKVKIYKQVASGLALALKDPVNVILGQSQLARTKGGEGLEDHYAAIEREARRVRATIENLMKVSGAEGVQLQRGDLHEIVLSALKEVKPELDSYGVHVRKDLRPVGQVMVDANKLKTAIVEILKNSIESMVDSGDKDLYLVIKDEGKALSLLIQDTGSGIKDEDLPKVFTPFFSTKEDMDHKGLGLSVAKGIVESCSGKMRIDGSGAQGTRVVLEFPLIQTKSDADDLGAGVDTPAEENTLANVKRMPGLEDKLPEIRQADLAGARPLTGSDADILPSVPSIDEEVELSALQRQRNQSEASKEQLHGQSQPGEILKAVEADERSDVEGETGVQAKAEDTGGQAEEPTVIDSTMADTVVDNTMMDHDLDLISGDDDDDEFSELDVDEDADDTAFAVNIRKPKVGSRE